MEHGKIDNVIIKEVKNIAVGILICSCVMQLAFLLLGRYNYTVFIGAVWGGAFALLNFFLMALSMQKILEDPATPEDMLKQKVSGSYNLRRLLLVGALLVSFLVPAIYWLPVALSYFFPTITIYIRRLFKHKEDTHESEDTQVK